MNPPLKKRAHVKRGASSGPPRIRWRYPTQIWLTMLLVFVTLPILVSANEQSMQVNADAGQIHNDVTADDRNTRKRTRNWNRGDTTNEPFTLGNKDQRGFNHWIDEKANPNLQNKQHGEVFFAYVLGKKNHTSALVRAHTIVQSIGGEDNVITFKFDVIQGRIDGGRLLDGESKIDFMTELTPPNLNNFGGQVALKTNKQTLPDWEENYPSQANTPGMSMKISGNHDRNEGWTEEFEVKTVSSDPLGTQRIINHEPFPNGYHLAYVKGGSNATNTTSWSAYCLIHYYRDAQNLNKARLLILDNGTIDNDGDVYINEVNLVEKSLPINSENYDNVLYKKYQDMFLFDEANGNILAEYLPSHLLYSPEDYTWDALRFKLVKNGDEELLNSELSSDIKSHYQDVCDSSDQCTIGKMLNAAAKLPDDQRTPILFIHGWQGDLSNAFDILHEHKWSKTGTLESNPNSGEAYWRNLLTYMYRHNSDEFSKYKPYVYHYPTYKHVKFNARVLKELLDELKTSGDEVIKKGIASNNLIIIAHSMGTIVSRSLMEEAGYLSHVKRFISLAGVHHGSPGAIASLMDSVDNLNWFTQKDLYTPGACDLISDNYDGFFDANIKSDIETNNVVNTKELLEQREVCGSVFTANYQYNQKRSSFDLFYLQKLGIGNNFYLRREMKVPIHPNPWLLNLNKNHYTTYQDKTKDKYYFYAGYVIADGKAHTVIGSAPSVPFAFIPNGWSDPLKDNFSFDELAAISIASESDYEYNDAVVPLSYGILDTSRGRLLQSGELIPYDIAEAMPDDLNGIQTTLDSNANITLGASILNQEHLLLIRGKNNWGANFRIFGDYNHDRLLNGGYRGDDSGINVYRTGTGKTVSAHNNFDDYYASVTGQQPPDNTRHFANDPVFLQISRDLNVGCHHRAFVMVVDSSGSNSTTDPNNLRIAAAKQTVERLNSIEDLEDDVSCSQADVAAAIDFDDYTKILSELADPNEVVPVFDEIDSSGGTDIASGINTATTMLENYNDEEEVSNLENKMALAVLTDGENNNGPIPVIKAIMNAKLKGIRVHYGHLQPFSTTRSRRHIEEEGSVVSHRTREGQDRDKEVLPATIEEAVLATGGVYGIIKNASAQLAFVEQIESQGFTNSDLVNPKGLLLGGEIETWAIISSPEQSQAFFLKGRQNTKTQIIVNTYGHFIPLVTVRNSNGQIVAKYDGSPTEESVIQLALEFHRADEYTVKVSSYDGNIGTFSILLEAETELSPSCESLLADLDGEEVLICRNISGTILDKFAHPIAGVTIEVNGKTTLSDETGYWKINGLLEGEYTITASKDAYLSKSKPCVVSVNEKVCQPVFKLESVLEIKVVPKPPIAKQAEDVTYSITVTNQGEGTATGMTLSDVLPDNTQLVSIEALDGGRCEAETITCTLPDLTPGATANVKLVISNPFPETLINTVTVSTLDYPSNVIKTWTRVLPYLSVSVVDQPDPIEMLKVLHYKVAVELSQYAPKEASNVTLVSQLPKGVELKSLNSDYGLCDTSAFPQITCEMNDLSVASADKISHATVEMDVELKDAGLLLLTHEAKVTASEYPAHSVRERTTVFVPEDIQIDLALVIDVTGSMQEEINGVIRGLTEFANNLDTRTAPLMALLTFGDEVKLAALTRDMAVLKGAIADLTASGGGLCEEASVEALLVAIPHTKEGGDILFATDASPYDDADVEKVIELLRGKGIRFNAMITGDCSMPDSWNQLP